MEAKIKVSQEYLALIKRLPLMPIANDEMADTASDLFSELGLKGKRRTPDEQAYLSVLGTLLREYEAKHLKPLGPAMTPQRALASLMEDNQLSQVKLSQETGVPQSVLSEFLAGKRGLSKANIAVLAKRFSISSDLFLP